jgi:hypothetical protein
VRAVLLLALAVLATPAQIDKAGRKAFTALRDFQRAELLARTGPGTWPTADQHVQITAKLAIARECIDDSLVLALTLTPGAPLSPQARSMLRSEVQSVAALNGYVGPNAPKTVRALMNKVQDAFAALVALFPVGRDLDEPPPR